MANGVYTALDNDINYLAHHGVKNMKWYQHLYGVQQSLNKYAKGASTKGVTPIEKAAINANKTAGGVNAEVAKRQLKRGEFGKAFKSAVNAGKYKAEAARLSFKTNARAFGERATKALAGAASRVIGAGLTAVSKVYQAGRHVQAYLRSSGARRLTNKKIKNKAMNFARTIRNAFRDFVGGGRQNRLRSTVQTNRANETKKQNQRRQGGGGNRSYLSAR